MKRSHRQWDRGHAAAARSAKQARIRQRWGCCCRRPRQTCWFLSFIGWTLQSKTALGTEKERKRKSSLMVETGAREKTSHTQENQTAAEQRETEELHDAGVELKMSAWLFLLLLSLSECNCVSFWAWDEDQKAQNRKKISLCQFRRLHGRKQKLISFLALLVRFIRLNTLKTRRETRVTWTYSWISIMARGRQIWQISVWAGASVTLNFSNQERPDAHLSSQHGWWEIIHVGGEYQAV